MTVTKDQAIKAEYRAIFHAGECKRTVGPRGGVTTKIEEWRVSGKCQTWKTRPDDFRLPVKFGLRDSIGINPLNAHFFHAEEDCPLRNES